MVLKIDVREAVIDAADELLGRFGYRKMSMEDVARAAGIGKGTIYLHFESKEEVALSTIDRLVDRVVERLDEVAAQDAPAATRLRSMLQARVLIRLDGVQHYCESLDDLLAAIRQPLLERRTEWFRREARVLARVIRDGVERGEFAKNVPSRTARDLLAATNTFLPYSLTMPQLGRRREIAEQVGRIADLLVSGLARRPG